MRPGSAHGAVTLQCALFFFFFNDTATTEIYTLSLHDALPISWSGLSKMATPVKGFGLLRTPNCAAREEGDRKSTRLNSSHPVISYVGFCFTKMPEMQRSQTSEPHWQQILRLLDHAPGK